MCRIIRQCESNKGSLLYLICSYVSSVYILHWCNLQGIEHYDLNKTRNIERDTQGRIYRNLGRGGEEMFCEHRTSKFVLSQNALSEKRNLHSVWGMVIAPLSPPPFVDKSLKVRQMVGYQLLIEKNKMHVFIGDWTGQ